MTVAPRDENHVPSALGVLYTDPSVVVPIAINSDNGGMLVNTTDTVQFTMTPIAIGDENYHKVLTWLGIS